MKISYLGGAGSIGASSYLVEVQETRVVIDCGIRFQKDRPLPDLACLNNVALDAILITHAHSDHTGGLPVIHQAFPTATIHMTPPTYDLVRILQKDALKIMGTDSKEAEVPLYTAEQVESMLGACSPVHIGSTVEIGCIKATFLPAGHILGAAMIHLETPEGHILFTGDYSVRGQLTVANLELPKVPVDILLTETTYGNRLHEDRKASEKRLIASLSQVIERGGRALIPAFAIGRAQEVLMIIKRAMRNDLLAKVPVHVDGMIRPVCSVYQNHPKYVSKVLRKEIENTPHAFFDKRIKPVDNQKRDLILNSNEPCILIASSGMLSGGASMYYAKKLVSHEKDAIFITGYQDEESPGRKLLELAKNGGKGNIFLDGKEYAVQCQFDSYSLSAHADKSEILGVIGKFRPKIVSLIHGDLEAKNSLKSAIHDAQVRFAEEGDFIEASFKPRKVVWETKSKQVDVVPTSTEAANDNSNLLWKNAKGSLLEYMKLEGLEPPVFLTRKQDSSYKANVIVSTLDVPLHSEAFYHPDEKTAEALACQSVLSKLIKLPRTARKAESVSLTNPNPKGKVLEQATALGITAPTFQSSVHPEGFFGRVLVSTKDENFTSPYYISPKLKVVERAAFHYFIGHDAFQGESENNTPTATNPKTLLNQFKQKKKIDDYGFEWLEEQSDGHQPRFTARGWCHIGSKKFESELATATTKKLAATKAAELLVQHLDVELNLS